jgi:hypothetical protein
MRLKEERYRFLCFGGGAEAAAGLGFALEDAGSGMVVVGRDKASATMEVVAGLGVTGSARRNGKCLLLVRHLPSCDLPLFPSTCHSLPPTLVPSMPFPSPPPSHYVTVAIYRSGTLSGSPPIALPAADHLSPCSDKYSTYDLFGPCWSHAALCHCSAFLVF